MDKINQLLFSYNIQPIQSDIDFLESKSDNEDEEDQVSALSIEYQQITDIPYHIIESLIKYFNFNFFYLSDYNLIKLKS